MLCCFSFQTQHRYSTGLLPFKQISSMPGESKVIVCVLFSLFFLDNDLKVLYYDNPSPIL